MPEQLSNNREAQAAANRNTGEAVSTVVQSKWTLPIAAVQTRRSPNTVPSVRDIVPWDVRRFSRDDVILRPWEAVQDRQGGSIQNYCLSTGLAVR